MSNIQPLRSRLRAIDEEPATRQTALIAALNRRVVGDLRTTARVADESDRSAAAAWIRFRTRVAPVLIAPLLADGELARISLATGEPDAASAAATLGRIEPLIAALELVLGEELFPDALDTASPGDAILLRLDACDPAGSVRHRLLLAIAPGMPDRPLAALPAAPPSLQGFKLRWTARIDAPSLPPGRLATLRPGDLFLLGKRSLLAQVSIGNGNGVGAGAELDINGGTLTLQQDVGPRDFAAVPLPDHAPDLSGLADVRVPVAVEIAGNALSATEIAGLAAGSVLSLPGDGGPLPVRVIAGTALIGEGELVAIGQGYGVIFTAVAADRRG